MRRPLASLAWLLMVLSSATTRSRAIFPAFSRLTVIGRHFFSQAAPCTYNYLVAKLRDRSRDWGRPRLRVRVAHAADKSPAAPSQADRGARACFLRLSTGYGKQPRRGFRGTVAVCSD